MDIKKKNIEINIRDNIETREEKTREEKTREEHNIGVLLIFYYCFIGVLLMLLILFF